MFGRKKEEQLQNIIEAMQKDRERDREMYVAEAEKNRQVILEYIEKGNEEKAETAIEELDKEKAAYALNLCTVSVSQIIDYNDLGVMEQEYDNILNNLNLQNFPKDEPLLKILKQILDVISFFRIQDGEKKLIEEQYKKKVKNAIWSAVPNPTVILAGGKAGWAGLAVSAISAVGTGYMNYRKERATIDDEKKQKDWELQKSAMEQFHALRRELFDTAWRLADAYDFGDNLRLTAAQITQYNKMLVEEDSIKRYERLDYVKDKFTAYPPFLYNLGHAAAEVYHNKDLSEKTREVYKEKARSAFYDFIKITDKPLLREDKIRAACALELFALVVEEKDFVFEISKDKKLSKEDLLEIAAKNSGNAFDTLQLCASAYLELGIFDQADKLLRMLVNEGYNAETNVQLLSMLYIKDYKNCKTSHETLWNRGYDSFMIPWPKNTLDEDLAKEHTKMFIEQQNKYLFENYKITVGNYITQCQDIFNETANHDSDISKDLVAFLSGIKTDMGTLFDEEFSREICDELAKGILDESGDEGHFLVNARLRKTNKEFDFASISERAVQKIAKRIRLQVEDISMCNVEDAFKTVAEYMNNLFLFKSQTKLLGGTAINRNKKSSPKSAFEELEVFSKRNEAEQNFVKVIEEYKKGNKLILDNGKKNKVNFVTENILESHHIKHRNYVKENSKINEILAYLDTEDDDILFTTKGVYRLGHQKTFALYNSGNIKLIDNKKLMINKLEFKHDQINIAELNDMITKLSALAPSNRKENIKFNDIVGEFPFKKLNDSNISGIEYCKSV